MTFGMMQKDTRFRGKKLAPNREGDRAIPLEVSKYVDKDCLVGLVRNN